MRMKSKLERLIVQRDDVISRIKRIRTKPNIRQMDIRRWDRLIEHRDRLQRAINLEKQT